MSFQTIQEIENFNLDLIFSDPDESQILYDVVCPVPGSQAPDIFTNALNLPIPENFSNPLCDDDVIDDGLEQIKKYIEIFYSLTSHHQFCR